MGNLNPKNISEDVISISLPKISKSDNPKVLSLFDDSLQYPESGLIAVSQECIKNNIIIILYPSFPAPFSSNYFSFLSFIQNK